MTDTTEIVARAIEEFVATPQTSQQYRGDIVPGFELRRDMPKQLAGGYWFSAKAVEAICKALASAPPPPVRVPNERAVNALPLIEELRERTALRYMGDCKCGRCQLIPKELIVRVMNELEWLSRAAPPAVRMPGREEIARAFCRAGGCPLDAKKGSCGYGCNAGRIQALLAGADEVRSLSPQGDDDES